MCRSSVLPTRHCSNQVSERKHCIFADTYHEYQSHQDLLPILTGVLTHVAYEHTVGPQWINSSVFISKYQKHYVLLKSYKDKRNKKKKLQWTMVGRTLVLSSKKALLPQRRKALLPQRYMRLSNHREIWGSFTIKQVEALLPQSNF